MRTATTSVVEGYCRILFLLVLFALAMSRGVSAQPAHVEWMKYEENGRTYVILNAFESAFETPRVDVSLAGTTSPPAVNAAVHVSSAAAGLSHSPATIHGLRIEYPVRDVPARPDLTAFLSVLEQVDGGGAPVQSTWKPETLEEWTKLLQLLTSRREIWLHGRVIYSREVSADLKQVYAKRGYPTGENPIFPHLSRGVLMVSDFHGNPLNSLSVDFAGGEFRNGVYKLVTFENLGSLPLQVFTESGRFSPIRLSGAEVTLAPKERTTRLITVEPSVFSMGKQESRALVQFKSAGMAADAFEVTAVHAQWSQFISGTLASATTSLFGTWDIGAALPLAAAAGGVLLAFVFFGMMRNSPAAAATTASSQLFRELGAAARPEPFPSRTAREIWYRAVASFRSGWIHAMALLRRIVVAVSNLAVAARVPAQRAVIRLRSTAETVRRTRPKTVSFEGSESQSASAVAGLVTSDKSSSHASVAASAWVRIVARTRDLMSRVAAAVTEDAPRLAAAAVVVTRRRLAWVQQAAAIRTAQARTQTASLLHEARLGLPLLAQETRARAISLARAARTHSTPFLEAARVRLAFLANAAGQGWITFVGVISRFGKSLAREVVRIGSGLAEASSRRATAMAIVVSGNAASLRASASRHCVSLQESAGYFAAMLRGTGGQSVASLRKAGSKGAAAAWQAARRSARAFVQMTAKAAVSLGDGMRGVAFSLWRRVREFAAAVRTGAGRYTFRMWAVEGEGFASLREVPLRECSPHGNGVSPEVERGAKASFSLPLRRRAATIRENAGHLAAVMEHDLASAATPEAGTLRRRVSPRAGNLMQDVIDRVMRLATNLYMYREWTVTPVQPIDGSECVNRMHRLINEMDPAARRDALRILRKEAKYLARRLESDLERDLVPRTTMNFQVLWSLRLLCKILEHPPKNFSVAVRNWLNGAERVVRSEGCDGIGPTVPEFLSYL